MSNLNSIEIVTIEIAGQVFWIDQQANHKLQAYLDKINQQLTGDECAADIVKDIELRIAELLYALESSEQNAITTSQISQVIEQIGFIEGEEELDAVAVSPSEPSQHELEQPEPENASTISTIAKSLIGVAMLYGAFLLFSFIVYFSQKQFFTSHTTIFLSTASVYLIALGLASFAKWAFPKLVKFAINKWFKATGLACAASVIAGAIYVNMTQTEVLTERIEQHYLLNDALNGNDLTLKFNQLADTTQLSRSVDIQIKTSAHISQTSSQQLKLTINYAAYGLDVKRAEANIKTIEYGYAFDKQNNSLSLDLDWYLQQDALFRAQSVEVIVEVPQGTRVNSAYALAIDHNGLGYSYHPLKNKATDYLTKNSYLHEQSPEYMELLSPNEFMVLQDKFCAAFYTSALEHCELNIEQTVTNNNRFDGRFNKDEALIEEVRKGLFDDGEVYFTDLARVNTWHSQINHQTSETAEFIKYINDLLSVKSLDYM